MFFFRTFLSNSFLRSINYFLSGWESRIMYIKGYGSKKARRFWFGRSEWGMICYIGNFLEI